MPRTLSDLLKSIPNEAGQTEVLQLGREVHEAGRSTRAAGGVSEQQLLEQMLDRVRWHFRAARYAVPGPEELKRMIDEHFS